MSRALGGFEWRIGWRYLRATRGRGFLSFISLVSVSGLALGVAVLLVVLSVMNGFERELRTRIVNVTSHASLWGADGRLEDWRAALTLARAQPGVAAAVPYVEQQGMLTHELQVAGAVVRGIDPSLERNAVGLVHSLEPAAREGLAAGRYGIVLGDALAGSLKVRKGDQVVLLAPEASITPAGLVPRLRRFTVVGLFHSGMYEYDRGLALLNLNDAARLFRLGDAVTGLRLAMHDPLRARGAIDQIATKLTAETRNLYYYTDWTREHANFFRVVAETKSMMFVILSLLVAIAAFNLLATLVMVVKDKRADIAILRTMGAAPRSMLAVFAIQGTLIGLAGTVAGALLGWLVSANLTRLVAWLERLTGQTFLDARLYFISDLPAALEWRDVLAVCGVAFVLCLLATLYPAWRAAGTVPAEALRHD